MNKEFVPYQESLELKELGFNEPCFKMSEHKKVCEEQSKPEGCQLHNLYCGYPNCTIDQSITPIPLPTFSQAFRWFRDKYKLHHSIDYECSQHDHTWGYNWSIYNYNQVVKTDEEYITSHPDAPAGEWVYDSDGEAELACLRKLIEIVKNC